MEKVKIGRLLFHDKILSANRNIACATCHSHDLGGSDGLSLGIGVAIAGVVILVFGGWLVGKITKD